MDADSRIVRVTSIAEAEQLKLEGWMVMELFEAGLGDGLSVGLGDGLGDGLANMTNVKAPCASTWPLESRRRAMWGPGPIGQ